MSDNVCSKLIYVVIDTNSLISIAIQQYDGETIKRSIYRVEKRVFVRYGQYRVISKFI